MVYFAGYTEGDFIDMFSILRQSDKMFYKSSKVSQLSREEKQIFGKMENIRTMKRVTKNTYFSKDAKFIFLMLRLLGVLPVQVSSTRGISSSSSYWEYCQSRFHPPEVSPHALVTGSIASPGFIHHRYLLML